MKFSEISSFDFSDAKNGCKHQDSQIRLSETLLPQKSQSLIYYEKYPHKLITIPSLTN